MKFSITSGVSYKPFILFDLFGLQDGKFISHINLQSGGTKNDQQGVIAKAVFA